MSYGMYIAAQGASAQSRRLEVISNNMANVDTIGFKPEVTAFQARYSEAIQEGQVPPGSRGLPDLGGGVKVIETRTDFSPGKLQRTGNDNDVAISGDGFFQVEHPTGETTLTRAGAMTLDPLGQLVLSGTNLPVLSAGGAPITLNPSLPWSINSRGVVEQEGGQIPMALVRPESLDTLEKAGANLFRSPDEVYPIPAFERRVQAGFLEMSGVNSTEQLMEMIETNRAFEANTQMIRHHDTATGNLISRVLGA